MDVAAVFFPVFLPSRLRSHAHGQGKKGAKARGVRLAGQLLVTCGPIMRRSGPPPGRPRCPRPLRATPGRCRPRTGPPVRGPRGTRLPMCRPRGRDAAGAPRSCLPQGQSRHYGKYISRLLHLQQQQQQGAYDCEVPDPHRTNHTIDPLPFPAFLVSWTSTTTCIWARSIDGCGSCCRDYQLAARLLVG